MIPRSLVSSFALLAALSPAAPAAGPPGGAAALQEVEPGDWRADLDVLMDPAAGPPARKGALARLGRSVPRGQVLELAPALADGEVAIRLGVVRLFRRPDLGTIARPERAERLALLAQDDPSNRVRRAALEALGMIGGPEAASRLGEIVEAAAEPLLRQRAAKALAGAVGGEETIAEIVQRALGRGTALRTDMAAVGALLPAYGRWLADEAGRGGELPAAPALPLVVGLRHPDPAVRRGAADAFEAAIDRLSTSGVRGQARLLLDRLASLGIERDVALFQSARLSLSTEGDARAALAAAQELVTSRGVRLRPGARVDAFESQLWLFRGLYLCGASHLALGELEDAGRRLDEAAEALDRALAERRDLLSRSARARHVNLLQLRAVAEVTRTLLAIARGAERAEVLELARSSHAIDLEAQAVYAELGRNVLTSWDGLLLLDLSAYRLLFGKTGFASTGASHGERGEDGSFGRARLIELQGLLGQALATVAPGELPGFTRLAPTVPAAERGRLTDPFDDPERLALLERIRDARLSGLDSAIEEAEEAFARARDRALGLL
ncbi:MAG: HEAT repeat domain-containing protein, partial [Planctomycetota bacterium]|nr:HEAT repeat domain-containing protein [Planctomycetota bacterium]